MASESPVLESPPSVGHQVAQIYKFSAWVHLGPSAETCPAVNTEAGTNTCANPTHFHAWCRMPNAFQKRDIRDKALAAKARRQRQLKDPESDGYEILEGEMNALSDRGESAREDITNELLMEGWWERYFDAVKDVAAEPDPDEEGALLWEHIEDDRERFAILEGLPEEERSRDEHAELAKRLEAHHVAVTNRFDELNKPERDALDQKDISELIDLVRAQRIDQDTRREFTETYASYLWLACTLTRPGGDPVWGSFAELYRVPAEVLDVISDAFTGLERSEREAQQGNS